MERNVETLRYAQGDKKHVILKKQNLILSF